MKKVRKLFVFLLIIPFFLMAACSGKSTPNTGNNGNNGGGNQQNEQPGQDEEPEERDLTVSEIYEYVFDVFNEAANNVIENQTSLSSKDGSGNYVYAVYDEFVYNTMAMVKNIGQYQNLSNINNKFVCGNVVDVETGKLYANKLFNGYYSQTSDVHNGIENITLHLLFTIDGLDFNTYTMSYDLVKLEMSYRHADKEISYFSVYIEKSRNYSGNTQDSYATYQTIEYSNSNFKVTTFDRLHTITNYTTPSEIVNTNNFNNFSYLSYDFENNLARDFKNDDSNINSPMYRNSIFGIARECYNLYEDQTMDIDIIADILETVEDITQVFVPYLNAEHKIDD